MPDRDSTHVPTKGPIREPHTDFPFEEVFARLGEPLPVNASAEASKRAALALHRVLLWLAKPSPGSRDHLQTVGLRVIALTWQFDRSILDGSPSIRKLAKQLHIQPTSIHRQAKAALREIGRDKL